jgi:iron complex transport system ATP-binding protein
MNKLDIQNISLSYNGHNVVEGLSFRLFPGEVLGLVGPNGCGKTSVIKAISRVIPLRSGSILLDDQEMNCISHSRLARQIGVVPQNPSIPDSFTVSEVVLLGRNPHLGLLRNESARDLAIVWWAMDRTGILPLAERRMGELSGGERQRVTIARVLAQEPQAILLDEPTANLDINHQVEVLDLIQDLCREKRLGVLIALHDLNLAAQYCHHILMLKKGALHAEGTPEQVITAENIRTVYGTESYIQPHPDNQLPLVVLMGKRTKNAG